MTPRIWFANKSASMCGFVAVTVFSAEIIDDRSSIITMRIEGDGADRLFENEAGGHRWQRVPPNEKRGRIHTSTVTVAVMPEPTEVQVSITEKDLEWTACRGSGAGGQNRNKVSSAVQLRHLPSGLMVRCESERSQHANRKNALSLLRARLWGQRTAAVNGMEAAQRKAQVGSGMRGDKRRTIREQDGQVIDHISGRRWRLKEYIRGEW
jgi:peptide chain release factor 1